MCYYVEGEKENRARKRVLLMVVSAAEWVYRPCHLFDPPSVLGCFILFPTYRYLCCSFLIYLIDSQMPAFNWRQISTVGAICYFNSFSTRAFEYNCKRCCLIFMPFSPLNRHTNKSRTSLTMPSLPPPFYPKRSVVPLMWVHHIQQQQQILFVPKAMGMTGFSISQQASIRRGRKTFRNPIITWISITRLSLLSAFHYTHTDAIEE